MPLIRKKGHHSKVLDAPFDTDGMPPLITTSINELPYANKPQMISSAKGFVRDLEQVRNFEPKRHEKTKKWRVYKEVSEYLNDISYPRSEIYPRCAQCEGLDTHRITQEQHSYQGKRKFELENYCPACRKFSAYVFMDDGYRERGDKQLSQEISKPIPHAQGLRDAVQQVVDFMQQMVEEADDDLEDLMEAAKDGHELVRKLRKEQEEEEADVVHRLAQRLDALVALRKEEMGPQRQA